MHCAFCEEGKTFQLKVEGDVSADAVWCDVCYGNLDIEDVPVSAELRRRLTAWARQYGKWMDWEKDALLAGGVQMEEVHNAAGELLAAEVAEEIRDVYDVRFSPSSSAQMYAGLD